MKKLSALLLAMIMITNSFCVANAYNICFWQSTLDGKWEIGATGRLITYKSDSTPSHINIPSTLTNPNDPEQKVEVETLGATLFRKNKNIETVKFNHGIKQIEGGCFQWCVNLQQITIPPELEDINPFTFNYCTALKSVYFHSDGRLKHIYGSSFSFCDSLTTIQLPPGLEIIGDEAFAACKNLTYINIPATVRLIGRRAFSGCNLKSIVIHSGTKSIEGNAFKDNENLNRIVILNPNCNLARFVFENKTSESKGNGHRYIYGNKGSTAEEYAKQYGYKFVTIDGIEDVPKEFLDGSASSDQVSPEKVAPKNPTENTQQLDTNNQTQEPIQIPNDTVKVPETENGNNQTQEPIQIPNDTVKVPETENENNQTQEPIQIPNDTVKVPETENESIQIKEKLLVSFSGNANALQNSVIDVLKNDNPIQQYRGVLSDWAKHEVTAAIQLGIVPDTLQDYFAEPITRIRFSELAVSTIKKVCSISDDELQTIANNQKSFVDCNDPQVLQAAALGIVSGYPANTFLPNKEITRQEAAVMLERMASLLNGGLPSTEQIQLNDIRQSWGKSSIQKVTNLKNPYSGKLVMSGVGSGKFDPNGYYTVEQAITTMFRLTGSIVGKESNYKGDIVASKSITTVPSLDSNLKDLTGYVPLSRWHLTGYEAQDINSQYFKNGKWVRSDGMVVLYLGHESSPDCLEYELFSKEKGSFAAYQATGTAEVSQDNYAFSIDDGLKFQVKQDGNMQLTTDWLDELYTDYGNIEGIFYFVKNK